MKNQPKSTKNDEDKWTDIENEQIQKLKKALFHLLYNGLAYFGLFVLEFILSTIGHSESLRADSFNNFSGIVSSGLLAVGLWGGTNKRHEHQLELPIKWAEERRNRLMRFRLQDIFTLVSGIIMLVMAVQVIISGINGLLSHHLLTDIRPITIFGALAATFVMSVVWFLNRKTGRRLENSVLLAAAQDSLSDAVTSLGTLISLVGVFLFKLWWLDSLAGIIIGFFILTGGLQIFKDSGLQLINYFDPRTERTYIDFVQTIAGVNKVLAIDAEYSGSLVTVSLVLGVRADMTVSDSYQLAELVENSLQQKFDIVDTKISFVPIKSNSGKTS